MKSFFPLLACLAAASQITAEECDYSQPYGTCFCIDADSFIDARAGYRNDNFKFTHSSCHDFSHFNHTLNEKWKNIGMGIIEVNAEMLARENWLFKFDFDYGWFNCRRRQSVRRLQFLYRRRDFKTTLQSGRDRL